MTEKEAIISFSQSEKIKSGLIWVSHSVERFPAMAPEARRGAEQIVAGLVDLVIGEAVLARRLGNDEHWTRVITFMEKARVMIRSGVVEEAPFHLTGALQQVTEIGRRAMQHLKEQDLL